MKYTKTIFFFFLCQAFLIYPIDPEFPKASLVIDSQVSVQAGESKLLNLKVNVPSGYGLVVGHAGKSLNMIVNFAQNTDSGIQIDIEKKPAGIKKGNNLLAKGEVSLTVRLS